MSEKPLHVQVAEALGWRDCEPFSVYGTSDGSWVGDTSELDAKSITGFSPGGFIPQYDTDWSATGPLLEEFGISVIQPDEHAPERAEGPWIAGFGGAHGWDDGSLCMNYYAGGETPRLAVCNLILLLAKEGKLESLDKSGYTLDA